MSGSPSAVVTGAMSYIGSAVATSLQKRGWEVRALTNRARPLHPDQAPLPAHPLQFVDRTALVSALAGARVLVNTYWVRYPEHGVSFDQAVANSAILFEAARAAGVERIVQVSVSNASLASDLPYYRGKAQVEAHLAGLGGSYAIVRPTWVVGEQDILLNNVAWFLRRFPVFAMPGSGRYRVQPISLAETGEVVAGAALGDDCPTLDAAGPEILTFEEVVGAVAAAIGRPRPIIHLPTALVLALIRLIGRLMGDVILTREEIAGLADEMLVSSAPPLGTTPFRHWLADHGTVLGTAYRSEWRRHFSTLDLRLVQPPR